MILTPALIRARLDRWEAQHDRLHRPDRALYPCVCGQTFQGQASFTAHVIRTRKSRVRHRLLVL